MADNWTKLVHGIIYSTVWQNPMHVKVVWITLLAMKNHEGVVYASLPGLASAAGVSLEQAMEAIAIFESPDPLSSSKEYEGRRIEKVDRGWAVLNHFKYRDQKDLSMREYQRKKQKEYRDKKKFEKMKLVVPMTYAEKVEAKEGCPV